MTLTDVMRGIYKQRIITKLPEELFTFLVGIIQEHNEVGFKPDFDMTNAQAMAAGGGNNRQSVKRRRDALAKFKIDGTPILTIKGGNRGKNTCCKYQIDYYLICRYNGVWAKEKAVPSQKSDGSRDDGDARGVTMGMREADVRRDHPKTRSEEVREDNDHDPPVPPETEEDKRHDMICDAFKKAIGGDPNAITLVSNEHQLEAFNEILEHKDEYILDVINTAALKGKLHQDNALGYVRTGLRNGWYGGTGGTGGSIASIREGEDARRLAQLHKDEARFRAEGNDVLADKMVEAIARKERNHEG